MEGWNAQTEAILVARFARDTQLALATVAGTMPYVRVVNAYYASGAFYVITHAQSGKIHQLEQNPNVALCGEWFTAHGVGENLGHVQKAENLPMLDTLKVAFAAWYGNGHVDENDPDTVLLRIRLTDGILYHHGTRYDIHFC